MELKENTKQTKSYKFRTFFMIVFLCFCVFVLTGFDSDSEFNAINAANEWLQIQDSGEYEQSWEATSNLFRSSIQKKIWEKASKDLFEKIGQITKRSLLDKNYSTNLENAPPGEYVVIVFKTSFKNMIDATEIITLEKDIDGKWKVSGYYVKK